MPRPKRRLAATYTRRGAEEAAEAADIWQQAGSAPRERVEQSAPSPQLSDTLSSLRVVYRSFNTLSQVKTNLEHENQGLSAELERVRAELARARAEAEAERRGLIQQQDDFIAMLFSDHAAEMDELTRQRDEAIASEQLAFVQALGQAPAVASAGSASCAGSDDRAPVSRETSATAGPIAPGAAPTRSDGFVDLDERDLESLVPSPPRAKPDSAAPTESAPAARAVPAAPSSLPPRVSYSVPRPPPMPEPAAENSEVEEAEGELVELGVVAQELMQNPDRPPPVPRVSGTFPVVGGSVPLKVKSSG